MRMQGTVECLGDRGPSLRRQSQCHPPRLVLMPPLVKARGDWTQCEPAAGCGRLKDRSGTGRATSTETASERPIGPWRWSREHAGLRRLSDPGRHHRLELPRHLVRTPGRTVRSITQILQATCFVPGEQCVQRLPAHPPLSGHLGDRLALCGHRLDCLVPLFRHADFPHVRECQASAETGVKHQPKLCQGSAEPRLSGISRISTSGLAGEEGLEPSNGGSKVRCLTTWRLPTAGRWRFRVRRLHPLDHMDQRAAGTRPTREFPVSTTLLKLQPPELPEPARPGFPTRADAAATRAQPRRTLPALRASAHVPHRRTPGNPSRAAHPLLRRKTGS